MATATACAFFGLAVRRSIMGADRRRDGSALNVFRMKLLGAEVRSVISGSRTLKDAMNETLRDWVANVEDTFYVIGTVAGPHPYPEMVRDFQCVIGNEVREQILEAEGRLPDTLVACIGGGSNAMGLFHPFLDDADIDIQAVEAAGEGVDTMRHAASLTGGRPGVLHGNRTYLLQDDDGQIQEAHSISAGLDYPGVGPEHAWLHDVGRVRYVSVTDAEALEAFQLCSKLEGILPALEPSHALAHVMRIAPDLPRDHLLVMNMCGRGDQGRVHRGRGAGGRAVTTGRERIATRFAALKDEGRAAFIPFIMAGDPDAEGSAALLARLPELGADLIEIGMPFSDPMADGPSIQVAGERALRQGQTIARTLEMATSFRSGDSDTPLILMGYFNPIYNYGCDSFARDAAAAGIDGLIIVDLPPEEDEELRVPAQAAGIALIRLAAPTTDDARLHQILVNCDGFIYYVSVTGITGTKAAVTAEVEAGLARIRKATDLPVAVGFGVRTAEQAAEIAAFADAVVVGSALVQQVEQALGDGKTGPAATDGAGFAGRGVGGGRAKGPGLRPSGRWCTGSEGSIA